MHLGKELTRLIKSSGGQLIAKDGHHETWKLGKKIFRVSTAGKRPQHVFKAMHRQVTSILKQQDKEVRKHARLEKATYPEWLDTRIKELADETRRNLG